MLPTPVVPALMPVVVWVVTKTVVVDRRCPVAVITAPGNLHHHTGRSLVDDGRGRAIHNRWRGNHGSQEKAQRCRTDIVGVSMCRPGNADQHCNKYRYRKCHPLHRRSPPWWVDDDCCPKQQPTLELGSHARRVELNEC
jgi:hypothetical protein